MDPRGIENISKMMSKWEAYQSSSRNDPNHLFKVAHAIIKKSIVDVEYQPSKVGEMWQVNDECLAKIPPHERVDLFRRLQVIFVGNRNISFIYR